MKITRKVGTGDLQHVRNTLLSVGIWGPGQQTQFLGACLAARKLGMMLRGQIVCRPDQVEIMHKLILTNQDMQILTQTEMSADTRATLELIIELEPEEIVTSEQVECGIIEVWNARGGRFARGNFGRLDAANLTRIYLT